MPTYSYSCNSCQTNFELFYYIKDYIEKPICITCGSKKTYRLYANDILTQSCSVRKNDYELKTLGDLAMRNSERMSEDEKIALYHKHNDYKFENNEKPLPKGMSRIKKQPKVKWPGTKKHKIRRKPK